MKNDIPFLDLKAQHKLIKEKIFSAWDKLYQETEFVYGKTAKKFEDEFAEYNKVKYAIAVDNGTSALEIALRAVGVKAGDEVITVSNTFIATVAAIHFAGAKPVFCDIDPKTWNMDTNKIEKLINLKTKVILPVNLYGQPADLIEVRRIANTYGLIVINDAAQSIGSKIKDPLSEDWFNTHTFADITTFSFYPGKNLGACGEAGAIITKNEEYASFCTKFRDHGSEVKYIHQIPGRNHRIDALQAAALSIKLKHIDTWNALRQTAANNYREILNSYPDLSTQFVPDNIKSVNHLFVILSENRDNLQEYLFLKGIHTGIHYKIPVHLQEAFQHLGYQEGDLPVTEFVVKRNISLPLFPELDENSISYIVENIIDFQHRGK